MQLCSKSAHITLIVCTLLGKQCYKRLTKNRWRHYRGIVKI